MSPRQIPTRPDASSTALQLDKAKDALERVATESKDKDVTKRLTELRTHFDEMVTMYGNGRPSPGWQDAFSDVERDITKIIGGGSAFGPVTSGVAVPANDAVVSATTGAIGTSGEASAPSTASGASRPAGTSGVSSAAGDGVPMANEPSPTDSLLQSNAALLAGPTTKISTLGKSVEPEIRKQLEEFRVELEFFLMYTPDDALAGIDPLAVG